MAQNALELYKRIKSEYDATRQPIKERAFLAPLGVYEDGSVHAAWPGFIAEPAQSWVNMVDRHRAGIYDDAADAKNALEVAGSIGVGSLGATPLKSTGLGMFGGRLAKTADHTALQRAEQMAASGVPKEQIWNETGWFQGPDEKWRFEIDDSGANVSPEAYKDFSKARPGSERPLNALMQHEQMYKAYPDASNMPVRREVNDGSGYTSPNAFEYMGLGTPKYYSYEARPDQLKSTALHELQHGIQSLEGFAVGGVSDYFEPGRRFSHLVEEGEYPGQAYRRLAGEVEAGAVQERRNLSPEERRLRPPWLDYRVPEQNQIITIDNILAKQLNK